MHGAPKYGPGFKHFDYVNPDAPRGGLVRLSALGTFDSLNPFILKGVAADGISRIHDTLLVNSDDEAFTAYGLIAKTITMPADRSWVMFSLRPEARFHNGTPIRASDVIFTFNLLKTKGHPFYRAYYGDIVDAQESAPGVVRFSFRSGSNRELPLIIGQMPVLSENYWSKREFDKSSLEIPLGNGPYRVAALEPGRSITYERVENYWGKDVPAQVGQNNFGTIRYDYYRDATVALEAFKAGEYDFRLENNSKEWASAYDFPALRQKMVIRREIRHHIPTGMQAFALNLRRDIFEDIRVREALSYAFDFEWTNRTLFHGAYTRTESYFSNSELAANSLPEGEELEILNAFREDLPGRVFTEEFKAPATDGTGVPRDNLLKALTLLEDAGWTIKEGKLVNEKTGRPMSFEILLVQPAFERITLPFVANLKRLGIEARVRTVDPSQYEYRVENFDFDMVVASFGQSLSPGNEQRDFWSSASANIAGSRNIIGIQNPVVDALIEKIINAPDRNSLVARTRALDRVLLWGFYVIPQWHIQHFRVAYWALFGTPRESPPYGLALESWWVDAEKAQAVATYREKNR